MAEILRLGRKEIRGEGEIKEKETKTDRGKYTEKYLGNRNQLAGNRNQLG